MIDMVSQFSSRNDNKFNDSLLLEMRHNDEITKYIDDACKAVVQLLPKHITYVGCRYKDSRNKMLERDQEKDESETIKKNEILINISDTYAKEAIFEFDCHFNGQTIRQKFSMWIPMLIDNAHFYIRGNKYSCPLQIIDAITFTKKDILVLKTITRAIKFERQKTTITDIYGTKYATSKIGIYILKKSVPVVLYYFACFGFFKTLKYFGVDKLISIYSNDDNNKIPAPKDKYLFKFGTVFLGVDKKMFDENGVLRQFVATVLNTSKRTINMDFIRNPVRWTSMLGESISTIDPIKKGMALLQTFNNSLDYHTRDIIRQLVPGSDRDNIFSVVRWIFTNYSTLTAKDDGLQNKRVRLSEYLVSPFIKIFTEKMYRFINTPDKLKTMNNLLDIFKIKPSLLLNAIIGKISPKVTGLNIAKFSNEVNDCSLTNTLLLATKTGPGSPSEKSNRLSIRLRKFHADYLGALNLIEGQSAGAPGLSHFVCPLNDTFVIKKKVFDIDPVLIKR